MRTVEEIIAELKAIADDPKKAMEDYKKETGKGAVGIMPVYLSLIHIYKVLFDRFADIGRPGSRPGGLAV